MDESIQQPPRRAQQNVGRIRRGLALYPKVRHRIEWVAEDRCYVPRRPEMDFRCLVVLEEGKHRCQCTDFATHGMHIGFCEHIVCAMVDRMNFSTYHIRPTNYGTWELAERRMGEERVVFASDRVEDVYWEKWGYEGGSYER